MHVITTTFAALLICKDILDESSDLDDAKRHLSITITKLRDNNCYFYKEWLKRWLNL